MSLRPGQFEGEVVCFETFRQARERRTARVLPYLSPTQPVSGGDSSVLESPFRGVELTDREVEHRQRMLRHLSERNPGHPGNSGNSATQAT